MAKKTTGTPLTYQVLKSELEAVLTKLQSEELDVDEALVLYQRGLELTGQLEDYLKKAENTIRELKSSFDQTDT